MRRSHTLLKEVCTMLKEEAHDYEQAIEGPDDEDHVEMLLSDATDYAELAELVKAKEIRKATDKYLSMDTASQDYLFDYLDSEESEKVDNELSYVE